MQRILALAYAADLDPASVLEWPADLFGQVEAYYSGRRRGENARASRR